MTTAWVTDLSDDELEQRLRNVGVHPQRVEVLLRRRDREEVAEVIADLLEAGPR